MAKEKSKNYKYCIVPMCDNTTVTTPDKIFFTLPKKERGEEWCRLMRRPPMSIKACYFCCEDHFNLKEDVRNYWEIQLMNGVPRLKVDAVPTKFDCQKHCEALLAQKIHSKRQIIEVRRHFHENPIEEKKKSDFGVTEVKTEPCDVEIKTEELGTLKPITCEELDYENDAIVCDEIEVKKEFSEEDTVITYGVTDKAITNNIRLKEAKEELYDDEVRSEKICKDLDEIEETSRISDSDQPSNIEKSSGKYKCVVCRKDFKNRRSLANHMKRYTRDKPHKCNLCDRKFAHTSQLVRHIRRHTGEKPFKCDFCLKTFIESCILRKHILSCRHVI